MFAKRLLHKIHVHSQGQSNLLKNLDLEITSHYGILTGSSILAFDHVQSLLAIGSLDGRIKVIGGDNIEGLLIPPRQSPHKYLEFLQNLGFLVSISNDNYIQVWNLETRSIAGSLHWKSNITAFTVVVGSHFMYIGDETGMMSVLKYEADGEVLLCLPYHISADSLAEVAHSSVLDQQPIVGLLPQPCSAGKRVLIAYENGLLVLWDVVEARTLAIRGDKVLQLKDKLVETPSELHNNISELDFEGKEISALCWASSSGFILAVGYVDGDIILWRTEARNGGKQDGNHIVKLQISPSDKKLPVIVLCWSSDVKSDDGDGQLFVYGGCEIGSEVITVLSLQCSSKTKVLRCSRRIDLTLKSPFVDMILLPAIKEKGNDQNAALLVLTTSGQLHYFDDTICSNSISRGEERISASSVDIPAVIPTDHPHMTVAKIFMVPSGGNSSNALLKIASLADDTPKVLPKGARWPLRGGISNPMTLSKDNEVKRVYIAGYEDGSVRMWDATHSVFTLLFIFESNVTMLLEEQSKIDGVEVDCSSTSISQMDFCFLTLSLAVGCESGLVQIYNFSCSSSIRSFHFVTQSKHEVRSLLQGNYEAIFCLNYSSIRALQFTSSGSQLLVGYDSGEVAVLDMKSYTILSLTGVHSVPSSQIVSIASKTIIHSNNHIKSPKNEGQKVPNYSEDDLIFVLTKDTNVCVLRKSVTGISSSQPLFLKRTATALSICIIDFGRGICGLSNKDQDEGSSSNEPLLKKAFGRTDQKPTSENADFSESSKDSLMLLCCKETIRLYHLETIIQGKRKYIAKVKLAKPCCWAATFKKDQMVVGLVIIFHNGDLEIRSLPELELIKQASLQSTLRWSFQENFERRLCSTEDGLITLVNGCELAFISLIGGDDNIRISKSLPSLHDKVLAAMPDTSSGEKQSNRSKLFGGIKNTNTSKKADITNSSDYSHLEDILSRDPFPEVVGNEKGDIELDIDDIKIDEPASLASSSNKNSRNKKGKSERKKPSDGADVDNMPKIQTYEEVLSKYRKKDPSVIEQAKNKLIERQQKLEMLSKKTEDLKSGAEDFNSLAEELVKVMKERKPWHY
ncbi:uncharacterized protein LOC124909857 [Impatiens glandulifera]|uniref:uncharacterized protein LOC124909857 n=1 Tax=Impatiens glandulifera TaxID=253017 RepID=UPI001FB0BD58|nr:uncharacterized protein LOC124909857 [Impatiens glandulifera]